MTTRLFTTIRVLAAAGLAAASVTSASCSSMVRESGASSYLIIESLQGFSGATDESTGNNLQSDVRTKGGVIEDEGIVTFALGMKDAIVSPTINNAITVTRYRVVYSRTDGRNTPGVDVPAPFDGVVTVTVMPGATAEVNFSLVRVQAKEEPPLRNLSGNFGLGVISTIAEVTFYGRDQTGRTVSVVGRISVDFADFADPE